MIDDHINLLTSNGLDAHDDVDDLVIRKDSFIVCIVWKTQSSCRVSKRSFGGYFRCKPLNLKQLPSIKDLY